MIDLAKDRNSRTVPSWWLDWNDQTCVIVASGPSAKDQPLHLLEETGLKTLAINTSFRLVPNADVLFACDHAWWKKHLNELDDFKGLKVTTDPRNIMGEWGIHRVPCLRTSDKMVLNQYNLVGWGGNSGFQSINLVLQFGVSRIILVGYDMSIDRGTHWHGDHPQGLSNPRSRNVDRWRRALDNAVVDIERLGVEVINTSMDSALCSYPKMQFEEALRCAT
jgi:hypothetical protein